MEARLLYSGDGEETIDLNTYCASNPASLFLVRVTSNAMEGASIIENDLAIIDRDIIPQHGMIVLAFSESNFVIRRYEVKDGVSWLLSEPPTCKPIKLEEGMHWGVVVGIHRKLGRKGK